MVRTAVRRGALGALLLVAILPGCGPAYAPPPNLSPQARVAWQATRVIKAIDVVRDIAVAGHETQPPVFTEADARAVVRWHEAALDTIHAAPTGWKATVEAGLAATVRALPAAERVQLQPYAQLATTVLEEVTR